MDKIYTDYAVDTTCELLAIDSPTGYTADAAKYVFDKFTELGCKVKYTVKGGVIAELGGEGDALMLEAHVDTLGGMVAEVKGNGRLRIAPLGGMNANNAEGENVRIVTRHGKIYEGTFQLCNASIHVNGDYNSTSRNFDSCEVVIDENVKNADDARGLGIENGDIVCFEPRTRVTSDGYIKSRFLDDKLSVGMILALAKYMKDTGAVPKRKIYAHVTVYEEVGHGGSASLPEDVIEAISVDMGCVGNGLACTEREVSVCAKDAGGPYSRDIVVALANAADRCGAKYAIDIYPHYGSDVEATLRGGADIKHGLIGAGVYASHGYERSHKDGVEQTLKLLEAYIF